MLQEKFITPVGFLGSGKARVLPHGPIPSPVHGGLNASGEWVFSWKAQVGEIVRLFLIKGCIEPFNGNTRGVHKLFLALWALVEALFHLFGPTFVSLGLTLGIFVSSHSRPSGCSILLICKKYFMKEMSVNRFFDRSQNRGHELKKGRGCEESPCPLLEIC